MRNYRNKQTDERKKSLVEKNKEPRKRHSHLWNVKTNEVVWVEANHNK